MFQPLLGHLQAPWEYVVSGEFFVSLGDPFKSIVCVDLVTHHKKRCTCAHYTPVLRENFLLTLLSINLLSGVDD